jgi:hypothetical protein
MKPEKLKTHSLLLLGLTGILSLLPLAAEAQKIDRSVPPVPEPQPPTIAELDARNAKAPSRFEVKAPKGAPNVVVVLNSAFFADQPVTFSIAKLDEGLMERAMINVRVFEKREAAAEWLGVRLQILYPPSKKT